MPSSSKVKGIAREKTRLVNYPFLFMLLIDDDSFFIILKVFLFFERCLFK